MKDYQFNCAAYRGNSDQPNIRAEQYPIIQTISQHSSPLKESMMHKTYNNEIHSAELSAASPHAHGSRKVYGMGIAHEVAPYIRTDTLHNCLE